MKNNTFLGVDGREKEIEQESLNSLKSNFEGQFLYKGIKEYDEARKVWNGMIDKYPTLILQCNNIDDVKKAVNFARENLLKVSIRGGGHNVAGNAIINNGLVIDLSRMNSVKVHPMERTAEVEGGATLGDIDQKTQKFGLATPLGLVSETGVAGLSLRGGIGHLMRRFGLTCDNILSLDLVTYDGKIKKVDKTNNPNIFWALKGGSVDLGVVTSFTFRLYPIGPEVLFYFQFFPIKEAKKVLRFLKNYIKNAPRELGMLGFFATLPEDDDLPELIKGKEVFAIYGIYTGPKENWDNILESLNEVSDPLVDLGGPTKYVEAQKALDEDYPEGIRYYWKSIYLDELTEEIIDVLYNWGINRPSSLTTLDIWFMGGAIQEMNSEDTAFNRRDANFMIGIESNWKNPNSDDENIKWARDVWDDLSQYTQGGLYMNFAGFEEDRDTLLQKSYRQNYDRMIDIKETVDPLNLF